LQTRFEGDKTTPKFWKAADGKRDEDGERKATPEAKQSQSSLFLCSHFLPVLYSKSPRKRDEQEMEGSTNTKRPRVISFLFDKPAKRRLCQEMTFRTYTRLRTYSFAFRVCEDLVILFSPLGIASCE